MPARGRILASATGLVLAASPLAGQAGALRLRSDNDAYRFWVPMAVRPDQEYSNGLELELESPGAPGWRGLAARLGACPGCATTTMTVGQQIFTPRVDGPDPIPGQRPYAGWLYASASGAVASGRVRREAGVQAGVTGSPSAARWVQTTMHRALGLWQPQGWDGQIPFEPGVALHYDEQRLLLARRGLADLAPAWGVSLGNVRTELRAGVRGRLGYRMDAPWGVPGEARAPATAYLLGAVRGRAVAHDLFLDGSTFHGSTRVERVPWVAEWEGGVGVRLRRFSAEYRVVTRTREYRTEPSGHQYGRFELTLNRK